MKQIYANLMIKLYIVEMAALGLWLSIQPSMAFNKNLKNVFLIYFENKNFIEVPFL